MRKVLITVAFVAAVAGMAWAADRDRHADYTDPSAADKGATSLCRGFYGTDDNLSPCQDWCEQWRQGHEGAACACTDGKCASDDAH